MAYKSCRVYAQHTVHRTTMLYFNVTKNFFADTDGRIQFNTGRNKSQAISNKFDAESDSESVQADLKSSSESVHANSSPVKS